MRVIRGNGPAFDQGEALRYLAEIPLNPDAILCNRALEWTVIDARTIRLALGTGAARGVVTFDLDDSGLITGMSTPTRMTMENGGLGESTWGTGNDVISDLRCSSAEIVKIGDTVYLITHDSFTGKVRTFHLYDNGQPNLGTMTVTTHSDWKDKNIFNVYYYEGEYRLLGVDTWTGNAVAYTINGAKLGETDWSRGWTSVDHLAVGGTTYRLLYKAAGDPQVRPGETNDQRGRFVIQKVNDNGVSGVNIYDAPIGADFSSVRYVPLFNGQGFDHGVFFFKRDVQQYVVREFNKDNGLGGISAFGQIKIGADDAPAYVDVEPYLVGTKTFLATISDDNSKPFTFAEAEQMGLTVHDGLKNKVVGYQFARNRFVL